jgi:hypothetical protein
MARLENSIEVKPYFSASKCCLQYFNMLQTISHILTVDACNLTWHSDALIGYVGTFESQCSDLKYKHQ